MAALFFQCMAHYFVLALFEIRKDYIATYLCEQKDRADNVCCGKCYLQKQMIKVSPAPQADKEGVQKIEKPDFLVYFIPSQATLSCISDASPAVRIPRVRRLLDKISISAFFHPPSPACKLPVIPAILS
ncbi:hypothetical protein GCM10023092_25660 [Rurimicrobium arvi]|uniref:Uncharacterized protein n=2 Tax=Rurimicrobium arvi TaxID=2049916 RepID=A0ABP8N0X1_9BACT